MPNEDFPVGRIELEKRPLQSTLNFISDRHAVAENREAIAELRQMLQAIIDHLGVSYPPNDFRAEE
ncbi:MAG: hypothetical protein OXT68_18870 [Chloroflexota bacterium]|nr:hypothetical protein [Chloroflexota bacterium]MDE2952818.1 hypothetical protein [Chloroflexota bacterium]